MVKVSKFFLLTVSLSILSGCVTQNYQESDKPVVESESSNNEIAMTRISLGLGYLKMGKNSQAKLNLEKAKRFAPNLVQVYIAFAHYYETVGEDERTIESYEKALSIKPDDADTLNNYGVYLCRKERLVEAEKQFLKAIAVPSYLLVSESYENLALCQLRAPNFEKAELYLKKAIDHSPSRASALYQMMRLQYAKSDYKTAKAYGSRYEKSTRRFNPEALALSIKIYQKLGNDKVARNYGTMLMKMHPNSWHARQYLLNELDTIDADELAEKYRLLSKNTSEDNKEKRVVVLSPNKNRNIKKANDNAKRRSQRTSKEPNADIAKSEKVTPKPTTKKMVVMKSPTPKKSEQQPKEVVTSTVKKDTDTEQALVENKTVEKSITKETLTESQAIETKKQPQSTDALIAQLDEEIAQIESEQKSLEGQLEESAEDNNTDNESHVESAATELTENETVLDESETNNESSEETVVDDKAIASSDTGVNNIEGTIQENKTEESTAIVDSVENDDTMEKTIEQTVEMGNAIANTDDDINVVEESETTVFESASLEETNELESATIENENVTSHEDLPQHVIVKGENLFSVSRQYNIRLKTLRTWNNLSEDSIIHIGDIIYLSDPNVIEDEQE